VKKEKPSNPQKWVDTKMGFAVIGKWLPHLSILFFALAAISLFFNLDLAIISFLIGVVLLFVIYYLMREE
jgi:hypothetical protein